MNVDIKIKLLDKSAMPKYKTRGSSGADCISTVNGILFPGEVMKIPLGFAVEIPEGYEMQIRPRSGMALKGKIGVFGTIDSDYRGEVCAIIHNIGDDNFVISRGDRVAQAVVSPVTIGNFIESEELSETERGSGGFGSTGI